MGRQASSIATASLPRRHNSIPIGKMWAKRREHIQRSGEEYVERIVAEYLREREREEQRRRSNTPRRIKIIFRRSPSVPSSPASSTTSEQ